MQQKLSARVKFTHVVTQLEKISTTNAHNTKIEIVHNFFKSIAKFQTKFRNEIGADAVSLCLHSDKIKTVQNPYFKLCQIYACYIYSRQRQRNNFFFFFIWYYSFICRWNTSLPWM